MTGLLGGGHILGVLSPLRDPNVGSSVYSLKQFCEWSPMMHICSIDVIHCIGFFILLNPTQSLWGWRGVVTIYVNPFLDLFANKDLFCMHVCLEKNLHLHGYHVSCIRLGNGGW